MLFCQCQGEVSVAEHFLAGYPDYCVQFTHFERASNLWTCQLSGAFKLHETAQKTRTIAVSD